MSNAQPGPNLLFPFVNPEFRRNLWLQMGLMRLIGAPVALGALFIIMMTQIPSNPYHTLEFATTIAFFLIVGVGGCRRAANAIPDEMKLGTWDNQRMSGMPAVSMAWAKLIGCTVFQWYAGLICLVFMMYARDKMGWSSHWQITNILTLMIAALCGQMLAMSTALAFIRKNRFDKRFRVSFSHLVGLVFMLTAFKLIAPGSLSTNALPGVPGGIDYKQLIEWHELPINRSDFRHVALIFSLVLSSLGLIRMMQIELRYRVWPVIWPVFTVAAVVFAAGFSPTLDHIIYNPLIGMTLTALALTYAALFLQPKDPVQLKFLLSGKAPLKRRLQHVPMWLFPMVMTIALGLGLAWQLTGETTILGLKLDPVTRLLAPELRNLEIPSFSAPMVAAASFAIIAFVVRDVLLIHLMAMKRGQWRSDWGGFFFLLGLYTILPAILKVAGFGNLTQYLMPFLAEEPAPMIISAAVQVAIMLALVIWRWRQIQPQHDTAPPTISADQVPPDPASPSDDTSNAADQIRHAAE